jgi:cell division protein FtsZ
MTARISAKSTLMIPWVVMENAGSALMGIGRASGEKRAEEAARMAINSPLLDVSIDGATGVLFSVTGGEDLSMFEVQEAAKIITAAADQNAKIIFGAVIEPTMKKGELKVTVIATGFPKSETTHHAEQLYKERKVVHKPAPQPQEGRIYNSITKPEEDASFVEEDDEDEVDEETQTQQIPQRRAPIIEEDDESDWGGSLPSFLRRSKLK